MPKKAVKKTVATKKAAPVKKVAAKKVATKKTAAKKAVTKKVPAKKAAVKKVATKKVATKKTAKKASAKPVTTTIVAKNNVGFGNDLYLRGDLAGLSWDEGTLMVCQDEETWVWESSKVSSALTFKVLLNDQIWSEGEDFTVFPGATVVFEPSFA